MTADPHALRARAQRWASRGRYGDAEVAYREALRLAPDDVRARLGLGLCLRRLRRPADAEAILREAARLEPRSASVRAELGGAPLHQGPAAAAAAGAPAASPPRPRLPRAPARPRPPPLRPGDP